MHSPIVRPKIVELVFRLYDRRLHPELFETLAERRVKRDGYVLSARVTPTGHVIEWSRGDAVLCEVTATANQPLPDTGRLLAHRFQGERHGRCSLDRVKYEMSLQVETLPPEVFLHVHEDLVADGAKRGMLFHFRPHHRLGLTPIGLITVEQLTGGLAVSAFHTFPDEFTVIKTQSLIEPW